MTQQTKDAGAAFTTDDPDFDGLAAIGQRVEGDQTGDWKIDELQGLIGLGEAHPQRHLDWHEKAGQCPELLFGHAGENQVARSDIFQRWRNNIVQQVIPHSAEIAGFVLGRSAR